MLCHVRLHGCDILPHQDALGMGGSQSIARRRAWPWLWTDCVKPMVVWEEDELVAANLRLALCDNNRENTPLSVLQHSTTMPVLITHRRDSGSNFATVSGYT